MCEGCTVHTEIRARKVRKSRAEAFGFSGLFSYCVSSGAAVLPCVAHPGKHGLKHHYQKGSRPSSYSLLPIVPASVWQRMFSGVWGRVLCSQHWCFGVWGLSSFFPRYPKYVLKSWDVFLPRKWHCHKDLSRTRMAAVWGLLFWWGFFLFESVFFLRSLSTTLNEWCFIFFQHRKFWWGGMLCKKQCYTSPVKCSKVGSFFTTKKAICLF